MAGRVTTHVLDTSRGQPASGMRLALYRLNGSGRSLVTAAVTNADGRTDAPLLEGEAFATGLYEIEFFVDAYFERRSFYEVIPVRFAVTEAVHHHVPLLVAPFGYSTYRGS